MMWMLCGREQSSQAAGVLSLLRHLPTATDRDETLNGETPQLSPSQPVLVYILNFPCTQRPLSK